MTDPTRSERIHTVGRKSRPGVALGELPPLEVITNSHAPFDHFDLPTLRQLAAHSPAALTTVPRDNPEVLRSSGLSNIA